MCEEDPVIGIDLGTTYSRAAVIKDGEVIIIHGDDGCQKIASYVFFTINGEKIVGNAGKYRNSGENPLRTIYGVKNFIGRSYEEYKQQEKKKSFHYRVENKNDKPIISVQYEGETKYFTPEEISAMVLAKLKERAEEVLGKTVTRAVITVPAHFNDVQRQATEDAGRIAGLEVLKVIDESSAAAMAYGLHNKYKNSRCNILVYDFGRSSFDASVVTIDGGKIHVKATNREAYLGGNDIDKNLAQHLIHDLKENHHKDLSWDVFAVKRIQQKCKRAKHALSSCLNVKIEIDCLYQEQDLFTKISRAELEEINSDLFARTIKCMEKTLEDAKLSKNDINEIVLTGGSSRIPRVREILQNFFNNKELKASLNPVETVAIGAARQAALLNYSTIESSLLNDVCSLDVGIETKGGTMSIIIPRNTKLPAQNTKRYQTSSDGQSVIELSIYEGEQEMVAGNRLLGKFTLPGLKSAPLGHIKFDVLLTINTDGILNVAAQEIGGHNQINITLQSNRGYYTEADIQEMVDQGERFKEDKSKTAIVECSGSLQ